MNSGNSFKFRYSRRAGERGQTIVLVAISIVSLLAMAALAIDVVTLYVARSEIQRAADAAALAGAKAIVDSGITSLSSADLTAPAYDPAIQSLAVSMATAAINATLSTNSVAANQPTWTNQPLVINYQPTGTTIDNNPHITVTLQQGNLPTFFARIFGRTGATVTASATAEAYNPANLGSYTPISPKCVKPWLVANADPRQTGNAFINVATGAVEAGALSGLPFDLTPDCSTASATCHGDNPPKALYPPLNPPSRVEYMVAQVTANTGNVCPACAGATNYEQSIECCDANPYQYLNCGAGTVNAQWDNGTDPSGASGLSATGAECLTHASAAGSGQGQDTLDTSLWPAAGPMKVNAQSGPQSGNVVSTSSSVVTMPIIDITTAIGTNVTIVGFLQAFINCVEDGNYRNCDEVVPPVQRATPGDINITIMNVIGCSATPNGANPIIGGNGTSPIPVRLITPP